MTKIIISHIFIGISLTDVSLLFYLRIIFSQIQHEKRSIHSSKIINMKQIKQKESTDIKAKDITPQSLTPSPSLIPNIFMK